LTCEKKFRAYAFSKQENIGQFCTRQHTFNHELQRLEAEYAKSTSKVFNIIPSQEDWHAFFKKLFILSKVLQLSSKASPASIYMVEID
jgi:hypothetical protein